MLRAEDALVLDRAGLAHTAWVLDPEAVTAAASDAFPHLGITHGEAVYVRLKPHTSCVVAYRFTAHAGVVEAQVRAHATASDPKLHKPVDVAHQRVPGADAAVIGEHTVIATARHDRDLQALRRLLDPERQDELLSSVSGGRPGPWELECLRYNPARRWVGRATSPGGAPVAVKVHSADGYASARSGIDAFATHPGLAAPMIGSSRRHRIVVHPWIPGGTAADAIDDADRAAAVGAALGEHLAAVHALPPPAQVVAGDELAALDAATCSLAALAPSQAERARQVASSVAPELVCLAPVQLIHGDCSVDQLVMTPTGPVLIDLDRAGGGSSATDLAQLTADLELRRLTGMRTDPRSVVASVMDAYARAGGAVDRATLGAATAARLLRVAAEPFRRRHPGWPAHLGAVLDAAERYAEEAHR